MRIFHELIADDFVSDGNFHFTQPHWIPVLGNFETMRIMVVADRVVGTPDPFLNMVLAETPNNTDTIADFPLPNNIILDTTIKSGQTTVLQGAVGPLDLNPASYGYYFLYIVGGTAPYQAHI